MAKPNQRLQLLCMITAVEAYLRAEVAPVRLDVIRPLSATPRLAPDPDADVGRGACRLGRQNPLLLEEGVGVDGPWPASWPREGHR
eukprot:1092922-Pleurochrysis_carterae.AAC.1